MPREDDVVERHAGVEPSVDKIGPEGCPLPAGDPYAAGHRLLDTYLAEILRGAGRCT